MNIKEVETQIGMSSKNIRFYEEEGLVTIPRNPSNGYRELDDETIVRLQEIKMFRCLGIALEDIRKYQQNKMTLKEMMDHRLKELDETHENMTTMKSLCEQLRDSDTPFIPYVVKSCNEMYAAPTNAKLPSMGKRQMNIRIFWACYPFALTMWMVFATCIFPMCYYGLAKINVLSEAMAEDLSYSAVTTILSILLGILSALILNLFYAINRQQFFEMKGQGLQFIDVSKKISKLRISWSILRGKPERTFQYLPYTDIYKVEPGLRVAGATAYNGEKLYSMVYRISTIHDESFILNTGLFGQDQAGIELLMETLKHHAQVIKDPYHLMEQQNLDDAAYKSYLDQVFDHHLKWSRDHHRSDPLWY